MAVALRDVADVPRVQLFSTEAAMRTEHRHTEVAVDDVLPFVCVRMPMQLAQRTWFKIENDAGDRGRDRKPRRIDAPFATAFEHGMWHISKHPKLVCLGRRNARTSQIFWNL